MITISRLYDNYDEASRAVAELERAGVAHSDISIIANNDSGWFKGDGAKRVDRDGDGTMTGRKAPQKARVLEQRWAVSLACWWAYAD